MKRNLRQFYARGVHIAQYGVILAVIGVVSIAALTFLGDQISQNLYGVNLKDGANQLFSLLGINVNQPAVTRSNPQLEAAWSNIPREQVEVYLSLDSMNLTYTLEDGSMPAKYDNDATGGESELIYMMSEQVATFNEALSGSLGDVETSGGYGQLIVLSDEMAKLGQEMGDAQQIYLKLSGERDVFTSELLATEDPESVTLATSVHRIRNHYNRMNTIYAEMEKLVAESNDATLQEIFNKDFKTHTGVMAEVTRRFMENRNFAATYNIDKPAPPPQSLLVDSDGFKLKLNIKKWVAGVKKVQPEAADAALNEVNPVIDMAKPAVASGAPNKPVAVITASH